MPGKETSKSTGDIKKVTETDQRTLKISDLVITDEFKTIEFDASGKSAAQKLMGIPRCVVLVVDKAGKAKGVITAREFLKKIIEGVNPVNVPVNQIMNQDIMEVDYNALLDKVVPKVTERDPYAVVVTDKDGTFKGYFSPKDYQEALARINFAQVKKK